MPLKSFNVFLKGNEFVIPEFETHLRQRSRAIQQPHSSRKMAVRQQVLVADYLIIKDETKSSCLTPSRADTTFDSFKK